MSKNAWLPLFCLAVSAGTPSGVRADDTLSEGQALLRALADELERSENLRMEDLEKPYFVQYIVDDSVQYELTAQWGALVSSDRNRDRRLYVDVRIGSYELDNTNFQDTGGFSFGNVGFYESLPLEDDYLAMRQSIWSATDRAYKDAVETLTKKRAYMRDKEFPDRPADFSKSTVVEQLDPVARLELDRSEWAERVRDLSAFFKTQPHVQDSQVQMLAGAGNTFIVNSEGTRLRTPTTAVLLSITAEAQAEDGMKLTDSLVYTGAGAGDLPAVDEIRADMAGMTARLKQRTDAPILTQYTGPVLFEGVSAAQVFRAMLATGVAGKPDPVGEQRRSMPGAENLEKKLGQRILPETMQVYDDPMRERIADTRLLGHYRFDDEGTPAERVDIVKDGELVGMVMSRAPTEKFARSNGHGRRPPGRGNVEASIGCLFVEDKAGVPENELKETLIEAARDEGLEFAIRVESVRTLGLGSSPSDIFSFFMGMQRRGGRPSVGDPVAVYKVYVEDGREEMVRGCEFGSMPVRGLKRIIAAGEEPTVYNFVGFGFGGATPPTTIVAPAVVFEELDLSKIEQENPQKPVLPGPTARRGT